MKIGLFTDTFPPEINGVANSTNILYRELTRHGHDVYVVTTYKGLIGCEWDETGHILRLPGIELKFLYGYALTMPWHDSAMREIEKLGLDIIHVQTEFGVGIFARICARKLDIPIVSTYHTTYEDYTHYVNFLHSRHVEQWMKKGVAIASKFAGNSTDEVIAPSEKTKELLEGYQVSRDIAVIPTGLPLDSFSPDLLNPQLYAEIRSDFGFEKNDKLVIYVGRLAEEKALDLVLEGFAEAKKRNLPVRLLIVGGGPDFERLQKQAKELHVDDIVRLAGPRPSNEVPDFYRTADAFVSASLSETQGMTFIEALASGLPLFARKDEVLKELLIEGKTGWYFSDASDFADALEKWLALDAQQLAVMMTDCVRQAEPYSSEIFFENILKVYERVIRNHGCAYTVTAAALRDTYVTITVQDDEHHEKKIDVAMDDYDLQEMKTGARLSADTIAKLEKESEAAETYQRCIRKLAAKDRSEEEMRRWIGEYTDCTEEQAELVLSRLKEHGYVNDRRFAESTARSMAAGLKGPRRIREDLAKKGISAELIEEQINELQHSFAGNAKKYAESVMRTHAGASEKRLTDTVRTKLMQNGFEHDTVEEVMGSLDMSEAENRELANLRVLMAKEKKHYSRKYSGYELKKRIFAACVRQGYTTEDIQRVMEETEWTDDQD